MSAWNETIGDFLGRAGSASPTPGGGSVAALAAALGAAMAAMAGSLTQGEKFAAAAPLMQEAVQRMQALMAECESLLEADTAAFEGFMTALRMPKASEEAKASRRAALAAATVRATEVPLRLMEACLEGMRLAERMAGPANRQVISDLGIGAVLLEAAARSARLTATINLPGLPEEALRQRYGDRAAGLMDEIAERKARILAVVEERIGSPAN